MLNKKILAASIAASFVTTAASAAVNLDATTIVPAKYASETVAKSSLTTKKAFEINGSGGDLNVAAAVGFGFTANTSFYVRYDLTNAVFETAITNTDLTLAGATAEVVTVAQGGGEDQSYVIFEYVDTAAVAASAVLTMTNDDLALTGTGDASIQMRVFANAPDAVNETGALVNKSGTLVTQVSALKTTFKASNAVADVDEGFTDFVGDKTVASLGSVEITLNTALAAATGSAVTRAEVMDDAKSTFVVSGDFSNALPTSKGSVFLDVTDNTCGASAKALTVNKEGTTASVTGTATLATATEAFVCLMPDPATTIAATDAYSATLTAAAGTAGTYAAQSGSLGSISRNGTTLEFPYITTFSDYNQRVLMTNNSSTDTSYTCTFTPEAGTTATAGTAASGTIPGNTTVSFKAVDMVTLTGKTRTAARCTLLSQSTNIDAATTIVNLSDKSTDTVTIN